MAGSVLAPETIHSCGVQPRRPTAASSSMSVNSDSEARAAIVFSESMVNVRGE